MKMTPATTTALKRLRAANLRPTRQRVALARLLLENGDRHVTAEQLHGEALAAGIQGTMLVKCVITIGGTLENCRIIKGLPHMERAVLDALSTWRYKPVHYQGRPVAVDYLIQIRLVIPH